MKRILIIEDDSFITKIYSGAFEMAGYKVATAADGEKGLKLIADFKPHLVQLDLMVPKVNGVEIIKRIRAYSETKSLPILVISNCFLTDMVREAWRAGASKVLSKLHCSPRLVLDLIEGLLAPPALAAPSAPLPPAATAEAPVPLAPTATAAPVAPPSRTASEAAPLPIEPGPDTALPAIRQAFLRRSAQVQEELRSRWRALAQSEGDAEWLADLHAFYWSVHSLAGHAGIAGFVRISHIAEALEVLLNELRTKPVLVTPSTLRTIAQAVDCLGHLFQESPNRQDDFSPSSLILAVDDEPIARRTLSTALAKADLKAVSLDAPELALQVLAQNEFDLIFLDVSMPNLDGFEVCRQLRAMPTNKTTPVVFVTDLSDFESRARSTLSGGDDLIAKPFPLIELVIKALTFLVLGKTSSPDATTAPAPPTGGQNP